jgi:hypothetical protein
MALDFTRKQKQQFLTAAELAGYWFLNNQNTDERPWGGIADSADKGRFVYEYILHRGTARGMGVWGQSLTVMNLLDLARRFGGEGARFKRAAMLGADYLKSLQVTDFRLPRSIGGFREHTPMTTESYPRDAITGGFGLCRLFRETQDEQWLDCARLFADWWIKHGTDETGWPYVSYDLAGQKGHCGSIQVAGEAGGGKFVPGDWQAGGAIFFYQLYRLTKEDRYIEEGFDPMIERLAQIYAENRGAPLVDGFHGEVPISYGNDDFALVSLVCACRLKKDPVLLDLLSERIASQNSLMDEDGSYPSLEGTFVCGINNLEYLAFVTDRELPVDTSAVEACLRKTAEFGLTLQHREGDDLRCLGGFYGQANHGVNRAWIHQRATNYALSFYLRLEGAIPIPTLSSVGW